jgi:predicted RNA-binding Zn ribbon-like protein
MTAAYAGPLRGEPLAVELHNTLYATGGEIVDSLADGPQARAWLDAIAPRLPHGELPAGRWPGAGELVVLRTAVRAALQAAVDRIGPEPAVLAEINAAAARAPRSPTVVWRPGAAAARGTDHHGASRADAVIGAMARDAIDLLTGSRRADLRTCRAPGCVLMFLTDHPRRAWCCAACGNRARQARHYARTRRPTQ